MNPFFEEGIVAAAHYYVKKDSLSNRAYDILAEAIQVNTTSIPLLRAYAREAVRMGFEDYATSALARVEELERYR
jgi:hypothetical protein